MVLTLLLFLFFSLFSHLLLPQLCLVLKEHRCLLHRQILMSEQYWKRSVYQDCVMVTGLMNYRWVLGLCIILCPNTESVKRATTTHAKMPHTCYSLLHLQAWYRYDIIAVSGCCRLQTVQNWRYQAGTVCWVVRAVPVTGKQSVRTGCNRHDVTALMEAVGIR